jgi:hypothetical protein
MSKFKERKKKRQEKRRAEGTDSSWWVLLDAIFDIFYFFGDLIFALIGRAFHLIFKFLD